MRLWLSREMVLSALPRKATSVTITNGMPRIIPDQNWLGLVRRYIRRFLYTIARLNLGIVAQECDCIGTYSEWRWMVDAPVVSQFLIIITPITRCNQNTILEWLCYFLSRCNNLQETTGNEFPSRSATDHPNEFNNDVPELKSFCQPRLFTLSVSST